MISFIDLPDEIDGEPPAEFADCFVRFDESKYRLTEAAKLYIADCKAKLEAAEAQASSELAAEREAHAQTRTRLEYRETARGWLRFPLMALRERFADKHR